MEFLATDYIIQNTSFGVVQKIAQGFNFDGTLPGLGATSFVPVYRSESGVVILKDSVNGAVTEGDHGGLFVFRQLETIELTQLVADLGADTTWAISLVTSDGVTIPVHNDTDRYIHYTPPGRVILHPGDALKLVTTDASKAMWVRMSLRNEIAVD